MNKQMRLFAIVFLCGLFTTSCLKNRKTKTYEIIKNWENKDFFLPDTLDNIFRFKGGKYGPEYLVVYYLDSDVCSSCRFNYWKEYFLEIFSASEGRVFPLLILSPKVVELDMIKGHDNHGIPILHDMNGEIYKKNDFVDNDLFRAVLINKEHKVICIGNPLVNSKIDKLYKEVTGISDKLKSSGSDIAVNPTSFNLGHILKDSVYNLNVEITNVGKEYAVVKRLTTTCDCIHANVSKRVIEPEGKSFVTISLSRSNTGKINERVFVESSSPESPHMINISAYAE